MARHTKQLKRLSMPKSILGRVFVGLSALVLIVLALELSDTTHIFHKQKAVSGTIPSSGSKATQSQSSAKAPSVPENNSYSTPSSAKNRSKISSSPMVAQPLVAPYGTFVSNHHPGENGSPTSEQSVCDTTPGASCYIQFTQGSITKTLVAETADSTGATYWSWVIASAGLTSGEWQITAVASANGQTMQTADPTKLMVQ